MFTLIHPSNSELIRKLNDLLEKYNHKTDKKPEDLQIIDALAEQIRHSYSINPSSANNGFMKWFLQHQIERELALLSMNKEKEFNKQKQFISSSAEGSFPPRKADWIASTTPKKNLFTEKDRSNQYREIDYLLPASPAAIKPIIYMEEELGGRDTSNDKQIEKMTKLQKKLLESILNDVPSGKPKMEKRLNSMLSQTNNFLNQLIETDEKIKETYRAIPPPMLIDFLAANREEVIEKLTIQLARQQNNIELGDFQLRYLGGNNNRNWLATNEETGEHYVIRLEKADDPATDYLLADEIKKHGELKKYIAQDSIYYPTHPVKLEANYIRPFNLAISEYCSRGDILSYRSKKKDPAEILNLAVDSTLQVAAMAVDFQKENKGYFDIKPENFLIREDDSVITADIKSVQRTQENKVCMNEISTTAAYAPPEYRSDKTHLDVDKFMAYQIGVMLYLIIMDVKGDDKFLILDKLEKGELDFTYPVFQSDYGEQVKELIQSALQADPKDRLSPEMIVKKCQELKGELGETETLSQRP